jgi:phosphoenolpyruvate carboxylase
MLLSPIIVLDSAKVDSDLAFLTECFRGVLEEAGQHDVAARFPWSDAAPRDGQDGGSDPLSRAYALAFQLLSLVEQNAAVQYQRRREAEQGLAAMQALWGQCLADIHARGVHPADIARSLPDIRVELVLTAHPTEAKRTTVLEHYRDLYLLLVKRENKMWTPYEQQAIRDEFKALLSLLWRTDEVILQKPEVAAERRGIMHYLYTVFPEVLPVLDRRLQQAWELAPFDAAPLHPATGLPRLSLRTWVGGDRDGHPRVTADVTRETLKDLRLHSLLLLRRQLAELARRASLSGRLHPLPRALRLRVCEMIDALGERGRAALTPDHGDTWRPIVDLMLASLPLEAIYPDGGRLEDGAGRYVRPVELLADLRLLYQSLLDVGAWRLADDAVGPILRTVQTFGFHLAAVDVRQNSRVHELAADQLMSAAGVAPEFSQWDASQRLEFLERELRSPRPFLRADVNAGPEARDTLDSYRILLDHLDRFGADSIGSLIVSMTRNVTDLLVVYLLAREVGLTTMTRDGMACRLPVVPLFETVDDLESSPDVLREFLAHPITRRGLEKRRRETGARRPIQEVMVGYSDSNKGAGVLASLWSIRRAEVALVNVAENAGVDIRFLHGRGGTMSRGGGPEHRFVKAIPPAALAGDLRVTEQGEAIEQKYANRLTAVYNLELMMAGTARATLLHRHGPRSPSRPGAHYRVAGPPQPTRVHAASRSTWFPVVLPAGHTD